MPEDLRLRNFSTNAVFPTVLSAGVPAATPLALENLELVYPNAAITLPSLDVSQNLIIEGGKGISDVAGATIQVGGYATFQSGASIALADTAGDTLTVLGNTAFSSVAITGSDDSSLDGKDAIDVGVILDNGRGEWCDSQIGLPSQHAGDGDDDTFDDGVVHVIEDSDTKIISGVAGELELTSGGDISDTGTVTVAGMAQFNTLAAVYDLDLICWPSPA